MNEICVHWEYELKVDSCGLWWLIVEKRRKERRVASVLKNDKKMDFLKQIRKPSAIFTLGRFKSFPKFSFYPAACRFRKKVH